ncbi:hypothetical protein ACFPRL_04305 [Pseudoclavibacter helvolus]
MWLPSVVSNLGVARDTAVQPRRGRRHSRRPGPARFRVLASSHVQR